MDAAELIKTRRSVRQYKQKTVSDEDIRNILEAGIWAPSGLNNQPWKFKITADPLIKNKISQFTKYHFIVNGAACLICVFLDKKVMYDRDKDVMAIGACIENMLLYAWAIGVGSCWLGEILNKKNQVNELLKIESHLELMAVITLGYDKIGKIRKGKRDNLENFVLK